MADDKFTVVIKRSPEYRIYPSNTVYGGPTPDGEGILMNFCVDHGSLPNYVQHPILEGGRVDTSQIVDQATMGQVEREILCGISLSIPQAKRLLSWLESNINNIEGRRHVRLRVNATKSVVDRPWKLKFLSILDDDGEEAEDETCPAIH